MGTRFIAADARRRLALASAALLEGEGGGGYFEAWENLESRFFSDSAMASPAIPAGGSARNGPRRVCDPHGHAIGLAKLV
eukprot:scaffold21212_cov101-Isochrysis_galbana.AAC.1